MFFASGLSMANKCDGCANGWTPLSWFPGRSGECGGSWMAGWRSGIRERSAAAGGEWWRMRGSVAAAGSGQRRNPRQDERECRRDIGCGGRPGVRSRRGGTGIAVVSGGGCVAAPGPQGGIGTVFIVAISQEQVGLMSGGMDAIPGGRMCDGGGWSAGLAFYGGGGRGGDGCARALVHPARMRGVGTGRTHKNSSGYRIDPGFGRKNVKSCRRSWRIFARGIHCD